jgi:hypothetical protein
MNGSAANSILNGTFVGFSCRALANPIYASVIMDRELDMMKMLRIFLKFFMAIYMKLNNKLVCGTTIAALLVIFGVVVKNTFEQMGLPDHKIGKPLGMAMFVLGWVYTAYILSMYKSDKWMFWAASAGVVVAVMMMKEYMAAKKTTPAVLPALFAASWVALGLLVSNHLTGAMKYSGLLASAMVLVSMMGMLPVQRAQCIVDGPGMPLFVIAWGIIVGLNGLR